VTTIGSSNLDARSLEDNEEANLWSSDPRLAQSVEQRLFQADLPNCVPITSYKPSEGQALESKVTKVAPGML
jgi:phosphatidylserine/phosphatidylglycerophosphate/cardiolipin synthase-like enzyme